MKKETSLVAFQNDALALAAANFFFPVYNWETQSERMQSLSNVVNRLAWVLKSKYVNQVIGLNPKKNNPHYLTVEERLQNLPGSFSPKIQQAIAIFQQPDDIIVLKWVKDTIHTSQVTDQNYQQWILKSIKNVWQMLLLHYKKFGNSLPISEFRPSILVLESANPTSKPDVDLAHDETFLYQTLLPALKNGNSIAAQMYDLVWREQVKRGVWEYHPREEA